MELNYKSFFGMEFNWKNFMLLAFLVVFPNILGLFHVEIAGIRVHFFQYLVFLAAMLYGPWGGVTAGAVGSVYTAIALNNPYIIIGNIILGSVVGLLYKRMNIVRAVLFAFAIQLPWLWLTDVYLIGMTTRVVSGIVIGLLLSNTVFSFLALGSANRIKQAIA